MKVIFIRHGDAENISKTGLDFDRELTEQGRKKLLLHVPHLSESLDFSKTKVFTSPLIRAIQTTEYLHNKFEVVDFLATGSSEELEECVNTYQNFETIVFVGHEPFISNWIYEFTGQWLKVKKGMAIVLEWPDKILNIKKLSEYQSF